MPKRKVDRFHAMASQLINPRWSGRLRNQRERDLRIDFVRGLALLTIFVDHNRWLVPNGHHWLSDLMFGRFFFIDAADVFFFLSGYVSGIVYSPVLLHDGFAACFRKAFRRCLQLSFAQISLLFVCYLIASTSADHSLQGALAGSPFFRGSPSNAAIAAATLRSAPPLLNLLPVYILFIGLTPLALYLRTRHPRLLTASVLGCYLGSQLLSRLGFSIHPENGVWLFNPFACVLIFAGGLTLGYEVISKPERRWYPGVGLRRVSAAGLLLIILIRLAPTKPVAQLIHSSILIHLVPRVVPLTDKYNCEPLRLVNLFFFLVLIAAVKPGNGFLRSRVASIPIACGRSSLAVYWAGVALNYLGIVWLGNTDDGVISKCCFTLLGCGVLVATGFSWNYLKQAVNSGLFRTGLPKASSLDRGFSGTGAKEARDRAGNLSEVV